MPGILSVRWLGHATFEVEGAGARFLIDPWITGNPSTPAEFTSPERYAKAWTPTAVLVTHAHGDHCTDAVAASKASGAPIVAEYDWIKSLGLSDDVGMGCNVGGTFRFGNVTVHAVPAMHS